MSIHRIAMWSGPRNISTAMMRSWGQRADTIVCDEPLYAHYLLITGKDHPGRDQVIAHHETNWRNVVKLLTGPLQEGKSIFYQKHMAHHLLPMIDRAWLDDLTNVFLIRDPREVLNSLIKQIPEPTIQDTGLPQQVEIFERIRLRMKQLPIVIDAHDVLTNPRAMLTALCEALDVPFHDAMLHWPAGPRETDGIWAPHWYASVNASTGFEPPKAKAEILPSTFESLHSECRILYERLAMHRLKT